MAYTVDCLRTNLPEAVELLTDAVMNQKLTDHEVANAAAALKKEMTELAENPAHLIMEAAHSVAFTGGLGAPLVATPASLSRLDGDHLAHFVQATYTAPRVVLAAAGVDHAELVSVAEPLLSTLAPGPGVGAAPTTYVGGDYRVSTDSPLTNIIPPLSLKAAGGTRRLQPVTVLNTPWAAAAPSARAAPARACTAGSTTGCSTGTQGAELHLGHSVFDDTGVIGISGAGWTARGDMVAVMARSSPRWRKDRGEGARPRQGRDGELHPHEPESRAVVAGDIGRQILTAASASPPAGFIAAISSHPGGDGAAAEALR